MVLSTQTEIFVFLSNQSDLSQFFFLSIFLCYFNIAFCVCFCRSQKDTPQTDVVNAALREIRHQQEKGLNIVAPQHTHTHTHTQKIKIVEETSEALDYRFTPIFSSLCVYNTISFIFQFLVIFFFFLIFNVIRSISLVSLHHGKDQSMVHVLSHVFHFDV